MVDIEETDGRTGSKPKRVVYPFTGIVGQDVLKKALLLNIINPNVGGVLIRGERGTAKSTAARALAALLPEIEVISDCHFGCNPFSPNEWCDDCRVRHADGSLQSVIRKTSFVDLPVSATEDRVVGTLDIEKAIQKGQNSSNREFLHLLTGDYYT